VIGTPSYMAPECFHPTRGYDTSFDIWSFGCVLFEIVVGEPPYGGENPTIGEMPVILSSNELNVKDYFSKDFKHLLYGVLNKDPERRMDIKEIQKHKFFKDIDWEAMDKKVGLKPPIKPKVANSLKVTNADKMVMSDECKPSPLIPKRKL
jgi:serine/threonine protein kinase